MHLMLTNYLIVLFNLVYFNFTPIINLIESFLFCFYVLDWVLINFSAVNYAFHVPNLLQSTFLSLKSRYSDVNWIRTWVQTSSYSIYMRFHWLRYFFCYLVLLSHIFLIYPMWNYMYWTGFIDISYLIRWISAL